jgi:hypothetical protein
MTSEEFERYFELSLEHFSKNPEKPFNFLSSALKFNPIDPTFKDHVLNLLIKLTEIFPDQSKAEVLETAARHVGSCIFLDICRRRLPFRRRLYFLSQYQKILTNLRVSLEKSREAIDQFLSYCTDAETEFSQKYWCCEVKDKKGNRCANAASGHHKGHQNLNGVIFASGEYKSYSKYPEGKFKEDIDSQVKDIFHKQEGRSDKEEEARYASFFHAFNTLSKSTKFFKAVSNHSQTCFCCLNSIPTQALKCGHTICNNCIRDFSRVSKCGNFLEMDACPLCYDNNELWDPTWKTKVEPPTSGVRILSLDGSAPCFCLLQKPYRQRRYAELTMYSGGIRSVVQLTVLELLEECVGLGIPIQDFFDLIIGTR